MVPTGCILILKALNKHGYILPHIYSTETPEAAWEGSPKSDRSPMTPSNSETSPKSQPQMLFLKLHVCRTVSSAGGRPSTLQVPESKG